MKIGYEVEGRFKGLKTLFVNCDEFTKIDIAKICHNYMVQQIYISDCDNKIDLESDGLIAYRSGKYVVTIERTKMNCNSPAWLNIVLNVSSESFWLLKGTDQVKFENKLTVFEIPLENMYYTKPSDFDGDNEIA